MHQLIQEHDKENHSNALSKGESETIFQLNRKKWYTFRYALTICTLVPK